MLTGSHTEARKGLTTGLLHKCGREDEAFCHKMSHEMTPGATHPRKKNVKSVSSARKLMATVFLGDDIDLWHSGALKYTKACLHLVEFVP